MLRAIKRLALLLRLQVSQGGLQNIKQEKVKSFISENKEGVGGDGRAKGTWQSLRRGDRKVGKVVGKWGPDGGKREETVGMCLRAGDVCR